MRDYDLATSAYLAGRVGIVSRVLLWVTARNRTTGAAETMGLWTGEDHLDFTIDGQVRTYFGAGGLVDVPPLTFQSGLLVRRHRVTIGILTPEAQQLLRGYDARLGLVEIHRALFSTETRQLVADPHKVFTGWIDELTIKTPAAGGRAVAEVALVSAARGLTVALPLKKSDEVQKLRAGDRFRKYQAISGTFETVWGETRG